MFLRLYPYNEHVEEAQEKLIELLIEEAKNSSSKPNWSPMDINTDYKHPDYSEISIENDTPYKLRVVFSGGSSKILYIEKSKTSRFNLPNGLYTVSVRLSKNPNIPSKS